ncbi:methyl-accepting chemotaxis protein [Erwinia sp. V71]|uniref:methyl-accepting chemotaxis protein n=1 Tax=Erwinia sp. V71 TaxID=3369424 RepID=UPI003F5F9BCD
MRITKKLYLLFSLLSFCLISSVAASVAIMLQSNSDFDYIENKTIPSLISLSEMRANANELIIWMYRHHNSDQIERKKTAEKEITEIIRRTIAVNNNYIHNQTSNSKEKKELESAAIYLNNIKTNLPTFINESTNDNKDASLNEILGNNGIGQSARNLISTYNNAIKEKIDVVDKMEDHHKEKHKKMMYFMLTASFVIILILSILSIKIIKGIKERLDSIKKTMEDSNENIDLTLRSKEEQMDEIGLTAKAFNNLMDKIISSLSCVSTSSYSVSSASSQISAGTEDLSSRTEQQAAALEQIASSMSELSHTVEKTAENTKFANELSQDALTISNKSANEAKSMSKTMSDIKDSAEKVAQITSIIDGIAFQTNILALNAAVEAARAGEHGKGFNVVAGEVRRLAQESSSSSKEIKSVIESAMVLFEAGATKSKNVEENMIKMNESIIKISNIAGEVSIASHEQSMGINQIHQALNQMDDVTQQNAALVEEASAASRTLMDQAKNLDDLVKEFTI